ncbi:hypothetical protein T03_7474 [Trichinella britovi]|uniref:Uncharacterized protein n=1 Tax=Trichinella britovi TaxID=45882 RepID=A0A0V1CWH4_TRIBR|nr:hypothetical protein T03_7474 [Trichinella britovi]
MRTSESSRPAVDSLNRSAKIIEPTAFCIKRRRFKLDPILTCRLTVGHRQRQLASPNQSFSSIQTLGPFLHCRPLARAVGRIHCQLAVQQGGTALLVLFVSDQHVDDQAGCLPVHGTHGQFGFDETDQRGFQQQLPVQRSVVRAQATVQRILRVGEHRHINLEAKRAAVVALTTVLGQNLATNRQQKRCFQQIATVAADAAIGARRKLFQQLLAEMNQLQLFRPQRNAQTADGFKIFQQLRLSLLMHRLYHSSTGPCNERTKIFNSNTYNSSEHFTIEYKRIFQTTIIIIYYLNIFCR